MKIKLPHVGLNSKKSISKIIHDMSYDELMTVATSLNHVLANQTNVALSNAEVAEILHDWADELRIS